MSDKQYRLTREYSPDDDAVFEALKANERSPARCLPAVVSRPVTLIIPKLEPTTEVKGKPITTRLVEMKLEAGSTDRKPLSTACDPPRPEPTRGDVKLSLSREAILKLECGIHPGGNDAEEDYSDEESAWQNAQSASSEQKALTTVGAEDEDYSDDDVFRSRGTEDNEDYSDDDVFIGEIHLSAADMDSTKLCPKRIKK